MTEYLIYFNQQWVGDHTEEWFRGRGPLARAVLDEMKAAGVRVFVGGLQPARSATSLRLKADGEVHVTDGPYIESKEHVGGFWILDTASLDEALAWGEKAARACRAPVEVRAIFQKPAATTN